MVIVMYKETIKRNDSYLSNELSNLMKEFICFLLNELGNEEIDINDLINKTYMKEGSLNE